MPAAGFILQNSNNSDSDFASKVGRSKRVYEAVWQKTSVSLIQLSGESYNQKN
jgi:hypothetical protein